MAILGGGRRVGFEGHPVDLGREHLQQSGVHDEAAGRRRRHLRRCARRWRDRAGAVRGKRHRWRGGPARGARGGRRGTAAAGRDDDRQQPDGHARHVPPGGHPSSRRMTGNRASSIARRKPDGLPELGGRGAGRVGRRAGRRIRLDGGEAAIRKVGADDPHQLPGETQPARLGGRRDAGDDGRQRGIREGRIEVARALRPRVGGQRPELRVGRRPVAAEQHLGVASRHAQAAPEELELARRVGRNRGPLHRRRRERVVEGAVVGILTRGQEGVPRTRRGERIGRRRLRCLEIGEERVGHRPGSCR